MGAREALGSRPPNRDPKGPSEILEGRRIDAQGSHPIAAACLLSLETEKSA